MKKIIKLQDLKPFINLFVKDENDREINIYHLNNVQFYQNNTYYPNVLLDSDYGVIDPVNETIQSLKSISFDKLNTTKSEVLGFNDQPLFFFIYNTDNYYHFIYDTLPYLISFFELKKRIPNLKLLMNYPNNQKINNYKFVDEFLNILSITENDIQIVNSYTEYRNLYISNSYTHDNKSNLPPRNEIYELYNNIVKIVTNKNPVYQELPKNIYISRRTWINKDTSNIGTNYTTRRKLVNEDEVVEYLKSKNFVEVFTENLSTEEKILLFDSAEHIVGPIGGGLCNVLFSKEHTKLDVINSPHFFEINKRFIFSFNNVRYNIINISSHVEEGEIKKYMRVKFDNMVGEVIDINDNIIIINVSDIDVAGWNNNNQYMKITKKMGEVEKLDEGLNSEWEINMKKLKEIIC
jgi:hypothetical protein